jgi:hypothetical protein
MAGTCRSFNEDGDTSRNQNGRELLFKNFLNAGGGIKVTPSEVAVQMLEDSTADLTMSYTIRRTAGDYWTKAAL